jgi:DNA adenine methylase
MKKSTAIEAFIPHIGGKKLLRKIIVDAFPTPETYDRYIEVFGGSAWVLLAKDRHANIEIYNDLDGELVNLFRIVKYHLPEFQRELDSLFLLNSREIFRNSLQKINGLTDIQRATRYFARIELSYGSETRTFSCSAKNIGNAVGRMNAVCERLKRVVIENKPYDKLIKSCDRPTALFYLDPPYFGTEDVYNAVFDFADHEKLCNILKNIKGKFILSYNDCDFIRKLYKDFFIDSVQRNNNLVCTSGANKFKELIIKNF